MLPITGYRTIISAHDLHENIRDNSWFVFDCRFMLKDAQGGLRKFNQGHIPGAQFANLDTDLSSPMTTSSGRHPLPDPQVFTEKLRSWGVRNDCQAICYDDSSGAFAARMWWLLNWVGHRRVAVLDGGIDKWSELGFALETKTTARPTSVFIAEVDDFIWVDTNFIQRRMQVGDITLLDARSHERFTAIDQKTDPRPGHVPGAINYPFAGNLDKQGIFLPADELQKRFTPVFSNHRRDQIISMCGSGVTACHNLLAMSIAGFPSTRLYVGSWSEWSKDANRPVATGEA